MTTAFYMFILFLAKVLDNTLNTAKTILVQRNRCLLAGVALGLSNFIYLSITKDIVTSDSTLALVIVSIASGVGCCLAVALSNRFSKDRTYVNVILSDDKEAMKEFRDFLAEIILPMLPPIATHWTGAGNPFPSPLMLKQKHRAV